MRPRGMLARSRSFVEPCTVHRVDSCGHRDSYERLTHGLTSRCRSFGWKRGSHRVCSCGSFIFLLFLFDPLRILCLCVRFCVYVCVRLFFSSRCPPPHAHKLKVFRPRTSLRSRILFCLFSPVSFFGLLDLDFPSTKPDRRTHIHTQAQPSPQRPRFPASIFLDHKFSECDKHVSTFLLEQYQAAKEMSAAAESSSDDDDFQFESAHVGSKRYPVHDCCEFEDAESLKVRETATPIRQRSIERRCVVVVRFSCVGQTMIFGSKVLVVFVVESTSP